jgi:hypothetical protein
MAHMVSRPPLTVEARFQSQASPCGIHGGQTGTKARFPPSTRVFPVSTVPSMLHTHSFITDDAPSSKLTVSLTLHY